MGKASRRRKAGSDGVSQRPRRVEPVPFVRRPFEGMPGEAEWVALREILPAATTTVRLVDPPVGGPETVTVATVLPMAWAGLHRADGSVLIATQSRGSSGDTSRDLAAQLLAAIAAEPGAPVVAVPQPTIDTPRLRDLIDTSEPVVAEVHDGFDFWVEGQELDADGRESLDQANASIVPTTRLSDSPSAFWCRLGDRTFVRIVLPDDEDAATNALARMHAAGEDGLGDDTRLLGAFRACGLLVPVVELDPDRPAEDHADPMAQWAARYAVALASDDPLTAEERRAKSGLLSRQVTLR